MRQPVSDVEKLVAINEIREVMARYARHADHKEFEDLAGLFTPDGTFTPHKESDYALTTANTHEPSTVAVSDDVLTDLERRLRNSRWEPDLNNEDMFYGVRTTYMKDLVDYWLTRFDWRKAEKAINAFNQH